VIEQALGHVAYGMALRSALSTRNDMDCSWLEVPFPPGRFGKLPLVGKNWTVRGSFRARRAIAREHAQHPFDALFIHTQTIGLLSAGLMARIPTLLSLDATPVNYDELAEWYGDKVHSTPLERAKLLAHRAVMRKAHSYTTWSEWAKRSLVGDYGVDASSITVVAPGTVLSNFPDPGERAPRGQRRLRVLFVGGDFKRKGGDLLVSVWRERLKGKVELDLVTAADLSDEPGLRVHRGLKPHSPELMRRYAEADVFALPTRGDCLAVVLGEAMASSLPIVTTHVGAHAEAVEDGESGYVISPDDARALGDRLDVLASDPELCSRMGRRSRQIGETRFDMTKNANRIADLLLAMPGSRRPGPAL